jgi:hypothetical protein
MKLSDKTIEILKNFVNINTSLYFRKGSVLRTVDNDRCILAEAKIAEEFTGNFGIYELNQLLALLSLHKETPDITIEDNNLIIKGYGGRNKVVYRTCSPELITVAPEKELDSSGAEASFVLNKDDFDWIMKTASVIAAPNIIIESDGTNISIVGTDVKDDAAKINSLVIGNGNGDTYKFIFKTHLFKMLSGNYDVSLFSKGLSHFSNKDMHLKYWIALEPGSTFTKK